MKRIFIFFISVCACASIPTADIKVDQVGYQPGAPKLAMVAASTLAKEFSVRRSGSDAVAFHGKLPEPVREPDSGDLVQIADFSKLEKPGKYYLEVPGVGRSWNFVIDPGVYANAFYLTMRSYYGQRCGIAVDLGPKFPGYTHAACHLEGAYHASSGKTGPHISAKGWHDAGDYGRYVVNSGISTGTLLWAWELYGDRLKGVKLDLPESGNGAADMLNEIRWNLDWMLSMQDDDGGVWHKQTSERFCDFIPPEKDSLVSYVIGTGKEPFKSSCATGDLAAVMAIAARVYRPYDSAYAEKCLRAARQAWTWLQKYPDVRFHNPPGVSTGDYGDGDCADELLWAAAELARTTGNSAYDGYFAEHYSAFRKTLRATDPPSWGDVAPLALWTYALGHGKNTAAVTEITRDSLAAAQQIVERTARHPYRISLTPADYIWGSNGVVGNYGMQLLIANALQPDPRYVETALDDLHYLLGRNTFSLSWVTQLGENAFQHPHHRPSAGMAAPWPGLLSGGPNKGRQDAAMRKLPSGPPARMYLDEQASYASNEVAINWNAPLVFMLAAMQPSH
ncbi:MAG: glycoside hydrolase family 9 protein [Bryobacteraceae bacterium]|jgi:endoglucanase